MIIDSFYRLHFGRPFEWSHVEIDSSGARMETLHLSDEARNRLTIGARATCAWLDLHDEYRVPGTHNRYCLRCGERLT